MAGNLTYCCQRLSVCTFPFPRSSTVSYKYDIPPQNTWSIWTDSWMGRELCQSISSPMKMNTIEHGRLTCWGSSSTMVIWNYGGQRVIDSTTSHLNFFSEMSTQVYIIFHMTHHFANSNCNCRPSFQSKMFYKNKMQQHINWEVHLGKHFNLYCKY